MYSTPGKMNVENLFDCNYRHAFSLKIMQEMSRTMGAGSVFKIDCNGRHRLPQPFHFHR